MHNGFVQLCVSRSVIALYIYRARRFVPVGDRNKLKTDQSSNYKSNSGQSAKNQSGRSPNLVRPDLPWRIAAKTGKTGHQIQSDQVYPDRNFKLPYLPRMDCKLNDPYIPFDHLAERFILVHSNS